MKEHGDGESNTVTRPPPVGHTPSDKMLQDVGHLQHLVSTTIPSPPFPGITLFGPAAYFGGDPRAVFSAHLLHSIQMAQSSEAGFQIPISLPLTVQTSPTQLYHSNGTGHSQLTELKPMVHPTAQLNIFSSWVKNEEDMKISSGNKPTGHKNKRDSNGSVNKRNKRNKPPVQHQNGLISSSDIHINLKNTMEIKHEGDIEMNGINGNQQNNESVTGIGTEILPGDKITKIEQLRDLHKPVNNNNNNIIITSIQQQQSNQQSRDKVFICPICNRSFGYKHVLQNHERTHTGEKPFECNICQKKFTRDHHLKTHMRLHTGEKPYQCTHCDRLFVQVANLRRHLRVHTGERPYSCDLCESRFSDSNQLKAHMLIHKGEKPYTCQRCGSCFRRRHHLVHHKCNNKDSNSSPPDSLPSSPPSDISPRSLAKRERKSKDTRRIIRMGSTASTVTSTPIGFGQIVPEQTHPEDLSLNNGNELRGRHFSGSHSSCTASPSPPSGGSQGSIGIYCRSITSSDPPEYSSDEDQSVTANSSNNGKTESDEASPNVLKPLKTIMIPREDFQLEFQLPSCH